jgi:hypothetical protein
VNSVKTIQTGNEYFNLRLNEMSGIIKEIKSSSDVLELTNGGGRKLNKTMADVDDYFRCTFPSQFNSVLDFSPLNVTMYVLILFKHL